MPDLLGSMVMVVMVVILVMMVTMQKKSLETELLVIGYGGYRCYLYFQEKVYMWGLVIRLIGHA